MRLKKLHLLGWFISSRFYYFKMKNVENGPFWFPVASWEAVSDGQSQDSPESNYLDLKVACVMELYHLGTGIPAVQHHSLSLSHFPV